MVTQYLFDGKIIATENRRENLPHHLRIPTRHRLEDLLSIQLGPSTRQVCVASDTYQPKEVDWERKLKFAFRRYAELADIKYPKFESWTDTARWHIKRALLKLKVIN